MTAQFARTPYRGRSGGSTTAEPHAALLIDFDNVTMGIRSDLTKELKNLLNSDIIKGKVAVQRAYADWRRYPQYIVPLAESSVDLIFAPAYGSAKKNATDIRLAIDAIELVFTRPEIGTIILLSGDSDFSSLVLKLKEYGKYVIGVGIRESASDLLVQNCDEYYSYSALTGLTRAGDEAPVVSEDPWELVELALRQMIENKDVMRSDRLKQVLLEMDPGFDEKALGFQKFNKFVQEAATRGLLSLRKQENGQFEVGAPTEGAAEAAEAAASSGAEVRESRRSRGRRGRGRRDESRREEPKDQLELTERDAAAGAPAEPETTAAAPSAEPAVEAETAAPAADEAAAAAAPEVAEAPEAAEAAEAVEAPAAARPRQRGRGRGKAAREAAPTAADAQAGEPAEDGAARGTGDLAASYSLLRRAMSELVRKNGPAVRDSDVKRHMLELESGWDESKHGFSKFSRFLRQAHDAEVVSLRKLDGGNYEVSLGEGVVEEPESRGGRRDRGRGRERTERQDRPAATREATPSGQVSEPAKPATKPASDSDTAAGATQATPAAERKDTAKAPAQAAAAEAKPAGTAGPAAALGFRRGSRGRGAPAGPPPLLPGQTAAVSGTKAGAATEAPAAATQDAATAPAKKAAKAPAKKAAKAPARKAAKAPAKKAAKAVKATKTPTKSSPAKTAAGSAAKAAAAPAKTAARSSGASGLPTDAGEIANHITAYPGVGPKTVQSLIETFGASGVFDALENRQEAVRDLLGARADRLLEAWSEDSARRAGATTAKTGGRSRGRRGGRGGGRKGTTAKT